MQKHNIIVIIMLTVESNRIDRMVEEIIVDR